MKNIIQAVATIHGFKTTPEQLDLLAKALAVRYRPHEVEQAYNAMSYDTALAEKAKYGAALTPADLQPILDRVKNIKRAETEPAPDRTGTPTDLGLVPLSKIKSMDRTVRQVDKATRGDWGGYMMGWHPPERMKAKCEAAFFKGVEDIQAPRRRWIKRETARRDAARESYLAGADAGNQQTP